MSWLAVLWLACASGEAPEAPEAPELAAPEPAPERTEPPFTEEQLKQALVVGTRMRYRSATADRPVQVFDWRVVAADDDGVTVEVTTLDEAGAVIAAPTTNRTPWSQLIEGARHPKAVARWVEETVTVPAGTFEAVRIDVAVPGPHAILNSYWYAPARPGPGVRLVTVAEGEEVFRFELESWTSPTAE